MADDYVVLPVGSEHCDVFVRNWQLICEYFRGDAASFYFSAYQICRARQRNPEEKYVCPRNVYNLIDHSIKQSKFV